MNSVGFLVWKRFGSSEADIAEKSPCGNYVRYKKILGRGAFKDVYKGFHQFDKMEIAWNQICLEDGTTLNSSESQGKLCSEAVLLKSLNHRNIIKCYSFWLDHHNKTVNMITEFCSCGSLRQYMKKLGCIDVQTIKNWSRQILHGLQYLHSRTPCIIHRDVKCDNIFVDASKVEIKIGDFGLATTMEQSSLQVLAGTPEFMAPEYYDEEYNELVDIYAFGMCLIELATCEYPYSECTNPAQIFKKVSTGIMPAALKKVNDPEVKEIIEKCLLPVSLRPSAVELLKDPFFSYQMSMEIEHNSNMDESSAISSSSLELAMGGTDSSDYQVSSMDESILPDIHTLYDSMSLADDYLASSCSLYLNHHCLENHRLSYLTLSVE